MKPEKHSSEKANLSKADNAPLDRRLALQMGFAAALAACDVVDNNGAMTKTDALIARLNAQGDLNAIPVWQAGTIRAQTPPQGPLTGLLLAIKDNINTADYPTSGGTPALDGNQPGQDAPLVARLRSAGAIIAGKANMHELSSGGTSANHLFGPARNPYDRSRVPGGSSGGVASAVAAGLVDAGIGTDTAGSVRVPASLCGVIGFRPSVGRYPADGIVPLSDSFDTPGPIARTMADILALDAVLAGKTSSRSKQDPAPIRLGLDRQLLESAAPAVRAGFEAALDALESAGAAIVPVDLSPLKTLTSNAAAGVIDAEFPALMQAYLRDYAPHVDMAALVVQIASPSVKQFTQTRLEKPADASAYAQAIGPDRAALTKAWSALFAQHRLRAIIHPTTPEAALPLHEDDHVLRGGVPTQSWFYFAYTNATSIAQAPAISLPAGATPDGMPLAIELMGLKGTDEALLALANTLLPSLPKTPPPPRF
ncbi:MAG: amidase family protein [Pseudomonadota bacterium]